MPCGSLQHPEEEGEDPVLCRELPGQHQHQKEDAMSMMGMTMTG